MGYAKYYEDNVEIFNENSRYYDNTSYTYVPTVIEKPKPKPTHYCPICYTGFYSNEELCEHLLQEHTNSLAFFVVNGVAITKNIPFDSIRNIKFYNFYRNETIQAKLILNDDIEIATSILDSHNRSSDLTSLLSNYVVKSIRLQIINSKFSNEYEITQSLNINRAKKNNILNSGYKSSYFWDEISEAKYSLTEYRIFLSILVSEKNFSDIEMLMIKLEPEIGTLKKDDEQLIDYCLYHSLAIKKFCSNIIKDNCTYNDYLAFCQLESLLNYDLQNARQLESEIKNCQSNFQIGCALLLALLTNETASINYYSKKYSGTGLLSTILFSIFTIRNSDYDSFEKNIKDVLIELEPFIYYPLINDICNVINSYLGKEELSEESYTVFHETSPIVCFIRITQQNNKDIRDKIVKSAIKRFESCEWFFVLASEYTNCNWAETRITKNMPTLYWSKVDEINSKLTIPYTTNFISYIKTLTDLKVYPLGNPKLVGCSCFVLSINGYNIMLDCGISPGKIDESAYPRFEEWTNSIDVIIITHAHIDHSGAIARAHSFWPDATIISTIETKTILEPMYHDFSIGKREMDELENLQIEKDLALDTYNKILPITYDSWINISNSIKLRLHYAGHLLGAAIVEIKSNNCNIVYTGDFCLHSQELCSGAKINNLPKYPDLLITEATYLTDSNDRNWFIQRENLINEIKNDTNEGKTILLPATAIGRAQELFCILADMKKLNILSAEKKIYIGGFAIKTCAALEKILNSNYSNMLDNCIPLDESVIPEKNSIIIASSGTMSRKSSSYKIAEMIRKRNPKELSILTSEGIDEDSWMLVKESTNKKMYPLSTHASSDDINSLIDSIKPKNLIFVHWGTEDSKTKNAIISDTKKRLSGNAQILELEKNKQTVINNIKENMLKELENE